MVDAGRSWGESLLKVHNQLCVVADRNEQVETRGWSPGPQFIYLRTPTWGHRVEMGVRQ